MTIPQTIFYIKEVKDPESCYSDSTYECASLDTSSFTDFTFGKYIGTVAVDGMWFDSKEDAEKVMERVAKSKKPEVFQQYYIGAHYHNNVYLCKANMGNITMVDFSDLDVSVDDMERFMKLYPSSNCPEIRRDLERAISKYKGTYNDIGIDLWIHKTLPDEEQCIWYAVLDNGRYKVYKDGQFDKNTVERILTKGTLKDCNDYISGRTKSWVEEPNMDKAIKLYFSDDINKKTSPEDIALDWAIWGQKHRA